MWNNRVWQESFGDESVYCIKETYYNSKGEVCSCSEAANAAYGETLEELKEALTRQLDAVDAVLQGIGHVVLEDKGFEFAKWDYEQ
jgi:hypothetical protein